MSVTQQAECQHNPVVGLRLRLTQPTKLTVVGRPLLQQGEEAKQIISEKIFTVFWGFAILADRNIVQTQERLK